MSNRAKPRRVDWTSDDDLRCAIMGAMGFSTQFIAAETGLSPSQIGYRLGKGKIRRADYRNGNSEMASRVIERVAPQRPSAIKEILNLKAKNAP